MAKRTISKNVATTGETPVVAPIPPTPEQPQTEQTAAKSEMDLFQTIADAQSAEVGAPVITPDSLDEYFADVPTFTGFSPDEFPKSPFQVIEETASNHYGAKYMFALKALNHISRTNNEGWKYFPANQVDWEGNDTSKLKLDYNPQQLEGKVVFTFANMNSQYVLVFCQTERWKEVQDHSLQGYHDTMNGNVYGDPEQIEEAKEHPYQLGQAEPKLLKGAGMMDESVAEDHQIGLGTQDLGLNHMQEVARVKGSIETQPYAILGFLFVVIYQKRKSTPTAMVGRFSYMSELKTCPTGSHCVMRPQKLPHLSSRIPKLVHKEAEAWPPVPGVEVSDGTECSENPGNSARFCKGDLVQIVCDGPCPTIIKAGPYAYDAEKDRYEMVAGPWDARPQLYEATYPYSAFNDKACCKAALMGPMATMMACCGVPLVTVSACDEWIFTFANFLNDETPYCPDVKATICNSKPYAKLMYDNTSSGCGCCDTCDAGGCLVIDPKSLSADPEGMHVKIMGIDKTSMGVCHKVPGYGDSNPPMRVRILSPMADGCGSITSV